MVIDATGFEKLKQAFDVAEKNKDLGSRLTSLKINISTVLFDFIKTGLLEKDKQTIAILTAIRVMEEEGHIDKVISYPPSLTDTLT